jgi:hypothetical protein
LAVRFIGSLVLALCLILAGHFRGFIGGLGQRRPPQGTPLDRLLRREVFSLHYSIAGWVVGGPPLLFQPPGLGA